MPTRRLFLRSSSLALVAYGALPKVLMRAALGAPPPPRKTLVVVFQRGACDGLNTLVPYGDRDYAALRPSIAIAPPRGAARDTAIDLDGFFGLHPALAPLLPIWREGVLSAVHAVGSPDATRSHFDAQDFMESGTPGVKSTEDGWLNRHLQTTPAAGSSALRAVALTATLPRSLAGRAPALAVARLADLAVHDPAFESAYRDAGGPLAGAGREAFEAMRTLHKVAAQPVPSSATYPRDPFGATMSEIARLVKADIGLEAAFAEISGWDHHVAEGGASGQLAARLGVLGKALAAFRSDLGPRLDDVVLVTLTEFGRTARENGNRGTDHGHAGAALVLGGSVAGGRVHGRWPGLGHDQLYDGRDLALTTDYRDLLGEILTRHMGARDLRAIFPGHQPSRPPGVMRG
jgi:uncharacterized protein (DUF1501 family)